MRAKYPDVDGHVERDGVRLGYEVFGAGDPTVLLLPTWTIIHSRFWKLQVPYLARRHRVITYDGPGNGRSDRVTDPARYSADAYAEDAVAVLDACGVGRAVVVGLSLGAGYAARVATRHPDRVAGMVLIGPALPLVPPSPERARIAEKFHQPYPAEPRGWDRYNAGYWQDHYADFVEFFFRQCLSEPHSTKPREDAVDWALETGPDVLLAEAAKPALDEVAGITWHDVMEEVACPTLVVHGTEDRIHPHAAGSEAARLTGGTLVSMEGSGHVPNLRDPVQFNLLVEEFLKGRETEASRHSQGRGDSGTDGRDVASRLWVRGLERRRQVLFLSSPIGLGHVQRDLAIADELRRIRPETQIDWLAQEPVIRVLEDRGERVHPASRWLASESGHIASEARGHELHCFQALRRMDEILVANFMVFQEVVEEGLYDLVVGDEAWDVDHFWHENPELKRGSHVWLTDFVGFLPMPEGGERESYLTADYNAEMIEHIARFPRIRDGAIFVGNADDVVPDVFGPGLPKIRDWTEEHFDFSGYIAGFTPPGPDERAEWRDELGYGEDEKVCVVTVGGSGVGRDLLERTIAAFPEAKEAVPELRMVAVAGPRIDPESLPAHPGLEVRGYVDRLYRHLAVCDLAVVQGGLTTTMELTAAKRPFLYFPLRNHFEQNHHVRHRLDQYGAGTCMDYATTSPGLLAESIVSELGRPVQYRDVETDGAQRAAHLIAQFI